MIMNVRCKIAIMLSACAALTSCVGNRSTPELNYYLLATAEDSQSLPSDAKITVQSVRLPPYLDRRGIVLVDQGRQIQIANFHYWAEPLDASIARVVQDELSRSWQGDSGTLDIDIHFFHGNLPGMVTLDSSWSVQLECNEAINSRNRYTMNQATSGYFALVEAHAELLKRLAASINSNMESQAACSD